MTLKVDMPESRTASSSSFLTPVRAQVFDHAQIQLSVVGAVLGHVGQPQMVRPLRGEVALHEVVMDRRADFAVQAAFLREMRPVPLLGTRPPHTPLQRRNARLRLDLIPDEPIPEPGLVTMDDQSGVDQIGVIPVACPTGIVRSAASSRTSGNIILRATPATDTRPPGAGSRSPAPAAESVSSPPATRRHQHGAPRPGSPLQYRPVSTSAADAIRKSRNPSRCAQSALHHNG
jgi:hypothetical protein